MSQIIHGITAFFQFIADLLTAVANVLVKFVEVVIACGAFLIKIIGSLPTMLTVCCVGLVVVCVVYKILGREGGES